MEVRLEDLGSPAPNPPRTWHTHTRTSHEHPPQTTCKPCHGPSSFLAQPTTAGFWAPPACTHLLGLTLPGSWSGDREGARAWVSSSPRLPTAAWEHSPDPSRLVRHGVLLHEGGKPQQRALVQEVDLAGKLPIDLQGL